MKNLSRMTDGLCIIQAYLFILTSQCRLGSVLKHKNSQEAQWKKQHVPCSNDLIKIILINIENNYSSTMAKCCIYL